MAVCDPEAKFLLGLFGALDAAGVRYAVMRNHHPLPDSAGGSDLDILIHPADAPRAKAATLEAIRQAGGVAIGCSETVGFFKIYALGQTPDTCTRGWWGLKLDFNAGLYFYGLCLMDETLAWPLQNHRGIPVLADGFAGVLGVLKEVLHNGIVPLRYAPAARGALGDDWPKVEALLAPMGPAALARLRAMLLSDLPADALRTECARLRQDFFRHSAARQGVLRAHWQRLLYQWSKWRRYARPSGMVLAILGVDGAGKSTLIEAILPALNAATHNAVTVRHLRPTLLPPLGRLKGKQHQPLGPVLEPHGSAPSGKLGSLLRLAYLSADYVLGYWLWTRPRIAKQPTVVIFDRYAYDMALDPLRFRIGVSARLAGWFAALAPKPDLIICLHGDAETIAARKGELSVAETQRQLAALRAFAAREASAVLVSTDTGIAQTRDVVLVAICDFLRARAQAEG